ncbi:MAG: hypothetical protein ACT4TC_13115, partial [Myxococcaceae bacterium]
MTLRSSLTLITALLLLTACAPSQRLRRDDVAAAGKRESARLAQDDNRQQGSKRDAQGADAARTERTSRSASSVEKSARKQQLPANEVLADNALEVGGLEIGVFPIDGADAVLDGDTLRVHGLKSSLRLLGLDAEETFKHEKQRNAYAAGWEQYKRAMRGDSDRPVKMATPVGDEAKYFAKRFFEG